MYKRQIKHNSSSINPEDLQLFYQIAISSKDDFKEAPSKKDHFIMVILRMIYFTQSEVPIVEENISTNNINNNDEETKKINGKNTKNQTDIDIWSNAIPNMSLSGLTLHLAMQSVLTHHEASNPVLFINEDKKDIYPKLCVDDLVLKIKSYFKITKDIDVKFIKDLVTPIKKQVITNENEINDRYDKVKDNPDINKLQKVFGANINKESIKKIIE